MAGARLPEQVLDEAISWRVVLLSGEVSADQQQQWQAWLARSALHLKAWRALENLDGPFSRLQTEDRRELAMQTLDGTERKDKVDRQRRRLIQGLLVAGMAGPALLGWRQFNGSFGLPADLATRVGQRQRTTLADGSLLWLNTDSAVDIDAGSQALFLRRGEIYLDVAREQGVATLSTGEWLLGGAGSAMLVHQRPGYLYLRVMKGQVSAQGPAGSTRFEAGTEWALAGASVSPVDEPFFDSAGWLDGALVAQGMPLPRFVAELGRYRTGWLHCDRRLSEQRVSGVFQLDDAEGVLTSLARSLPVRVRYITPLWVELTPA